MAGAEHHRRQRERILLAARDQFAERGFDAVTVAEIAVEAGVSRATVFNHFGSKAGLVDATVAGVMVFYESMLERALADKTSTTAELIVDLFEQMGRGIELDRRYYRGVFREVARFQFNVDEGDVGYDVIQRARLRLVELLQRGIDRGDVRGELQAETLASAISSLTNGTITEWLFGDDESGLIERMVDSAGVIVAALGSGPRR